MKLAITGAHGFLGWHLSCRLRARHGIEAVRLGRKEFADKQLLSNALADRDVVIHLAGVNRADSDEAVEAGNVVLAQAVASALGDRPVHIVFGNSVQSSLDNPYGRGKRRAAEILAALPGSFADVLLPNLFGEHGRPAYNSFVATFCHEVARGGSPRVIGDRRVPLLHAQDAAAALIDAAGSAVRHSVRPPTQSHGVSEVLGSIRCFHDLYAVKGEVPDLSSKFAVDLFNTYRSYAFPAQFPIFAPVHADDRGELVRDGAFTWRYRPDLRLHDGSRSHARRALPPAQGGALLRGEGGSGDLPAPTAP